MEHETYYSQSDEIDQLEAALLKFRSEVPEIAKTEKAEARSFSYTYASLAGVLSVVDPLLIRVGVLHVQTPLGENALKTRLSHPASKQWLEGVMVMHPGSSATPQDIGGLISFMRRYSLTAMLGLRTVDDDGAGAGEKPLGRKPESGGKKGKVITPEQVEALQKAAHENFGDAAREIAPSIIGRFGYRKSVEVLEDDFEAVLAALKGEG